MENKDKKKLDSETALAKIKVIVSGYFEAIGRGGVDEDNLKFEAINDIDDVLYDTKLDSKKVIIEKLELDKSNSVTQEW